MSTRLLTQTGEVVTKNLTSRHHPFFEAPDYSDGVLKTLRERAMPTLRMVNELHLPQYPDSLHANVQPPIVPCSDLAKLLIRHMEGLSPLRDSYERFREANSYLGYLSVFGPCGQVQDEAGQLHDNFTQQAVYIEAGKVQYHGTAA